MHITMVAVTSADGKLTKGDNPDVHAWASSQDHEHYAALLKQHVVHIMGAHTYDIMQPQPQDRRLQIVLTPKPEQYAGQTMPGSLEFSSEKPAALVARLTAAGHPDALVLGGGYVFGSFVQAGLMNEIYQTIEPYMFGEGTELLGGQAVDAKLTLMEMKPLNQTGTLLLRWQVEN